MERRRTSLCKPLLRVSIPSYTRSVSSLTASLCSFPQLLVDSVSYSYVSPYLESHLHRYCGSILQNRSTLDRSLTFCCFPLSFTLRRSLEYPRCINSVCSRKLLKKISDDFSLSPPPAVSSECHSRFLCDDGTSSSNDWSSLVRLLIPSRSLPRSNPTNQCFLLSRNQH